MAKSDKKKKKRQETRPNSSDAQVVVKLYDLRREAVMRASRDTILRWVPRSYEEFVAITQFDAPNNAAFRQVSSYFEMVYGLARHGAVERELLAEWCGEGLLLFAKVHPHLERFRAEVAPKAFTNAEWIVANTEYGRMRFEVFQATVAQWLAQGAEPSGETGD